jgi:hypothetical protein
MSLCAWGLTVFSATKYQRRRFFESRFRANFSPRAVAGPRREKICSGRYQPHRFRAEAENPRSDDMKRSSIGAINRVASLTGVPVSLPSASA